MTYFQPRIPYRFSNASGSEYFDFPLADYSAEWKQPLLTPDAALTGASGTLDLLGDGQAPKGPITLSIAFASYEEDPEDVDATIDEMLEKIYRFGRGRLYTKGSEAGVEVLRYARARATEMPALSWKAGDVTHKQASVQFRCDPLWFGTTDITATTVTATGTLTVAVQPTAGDTFTIGATVYTFVASGANDPGEINVGANLAAAKVNIKAAINGTDGWNTPNASATAATFSGDTCLITATTTGHVGNGIAFTETFTDVANVMNGGGYLGGTTAGDGGTYTAIRGGFTLTNPGSAPIYDAVLTLTGTVSSPVIRNTTNGYQVALDRADSAVYAFDAGAGTVKRNGIDDYAHYVRQSGQIHLMVLDPGANVFTITGVSAGTITIAANPAYH